MWLEGDFVQWGCVLWFCPVTVTWVGLCPSKLFYEWGFVQCGYVLVWFCPGSVSTYGHMIRTPQYKLAREILEANRAYSRSRERPMTKWMDHIQNLRYNRIWTGISADLRFELSRRGRWSIFPHDLTYDWLIGLWRLWRRRWWLCWR